MKTLTFRYLVSLLGSLMTVGVVMFTLRQLYMELAFVPFIRGGLARLANQFDALPFNFAQQLFNLPNLEDDWPVDAIAFAFGSVVICLMIPILRGKSAVLGLSLLTAIYIVLESYRSRMWPISLVSDRNHLGYPYELTCMGFQMIIPLLTVPTGFLTYKWLNKLDDIMLTRAKTSKKGLVRW